MHSESDGRVAIVTGASRGIGRATALRLALEFDQVTVVARSPPALEESASDNPVFRVRLPAANGADD